jgi:hypothetical protein
MPLFNEALALIRANLEELQKGGRPKIVLVGTLSVVQLDAINQERKSHGIPPTNGEVVFLGRHIYQGRIVRDGYTVDDVVDQIASGMDSAAVVRQATAMTAMENPFPRKDRYGNSVRDRIIFEGSLRHPRLELFTVVPKGDRIKPKKAAHE